MAFHRDGDLIILVMREPLYERLTLALMASAGLAVTWVGQDAAQAILDVYNDINAGNPDVVKRMKA